MVTMEDKRGSTGYARVGGDVLRFPLWWYTDGMFLVGGRLVRVARRAAATLGLRVWMANIFTPMFGRYDWQSRVISVFMRIVNIVGRGCAWSVGAVGLSLVFVLYLFLPLLTLLGFWFSFGTV